MKYFGVVITNELLELGGILQTQLVTVGVELKCSWSLEMHHLCSEMYVCCREVVAATPATGVPQPHVQGPKEEHWRQGAVLIQAVPQLAALGAGLHLAIPETGPIPSTHQHRTDSAPVLHTWPLLRTLPPHFESQDTGTVWRQPSAPETPSHCFCELCSSKSTWMWEHWSDWF